MENLQDRVTKLEAQIDRHTSELESEKGTRKRRNDQIDKILHGNGKEGILVRLDRLEESRKQTRWLWGLVIAGVVEKILSLLDIW